MLHTENDDYENYDRNAVSDGSNTPAERLFEEAYSSRVPNPHNWTPEVPSPLSPVQVERKLKYEGSAEEATAIKVMFKAAREEIETLGATLDTTRLERILTSIADQSEPNRTRMLSYFGGLLRQDLSPMFNVNWESGEKSSGKPFVRFRFTRVDSAFPELLAGTVGSDGMTVGREDGVAKPIGNVLPRLFAIDLATGRLDRRPGPGLGDYNNSPGPTAEANQPPKIEPDHRIFPR